MLQDSDFDDMMMHFDGYLDMDCEEEDDGVEERVVCHTRALGIRCLTA